MKVKSFKCTIYAVNQIDVYLTIILYNLFTYSNLFKLVYSLARSIEARQSISF